MENKEIYHDFLNPISCLEGMVCPFAGPKGAKVSAEDVVLENFGKYLKKVA